MGRRPNLTSGELERIAFMTETRKWGIQRIADEIGCSIGSVYWAQLRIGADKDVSKSLPPVPTERRTYVRNNFTCYGFNQSDDGILRKLDEQGVSHAEIGRRMHPKRLPNSVKGRLMTLARRDARAEHQAARSKRAAPCIAEAHHE